MEYYGSKILLDNGANEVYNYNVTNKKSVCKIRKYKKNKILDYNLIEHQKFTDNTFDCLVSFNTILFVENRQDILKMFKNILKEGGTGVISIPNLDLLDYPIYKKLDLKTNYLKNEFLLDLQELFDVELYSLMFKTDSNIETKLNEKMLNKVQSLFLKSVKKPIKFLMSKIDKNFNFFELYLKEKYNKLTEYDKKKFSKEIEISPVKQSTESNSLYYIAVIKNIIE
jgi:SAM-dependent methyltransferase